MKQIKSFYKRENIEILLVFGPEIFISLQSYFDNAFRVNWDQLFCFKITSIIVPDLKGTPFAKKILLRSLGQDFTAKSRISMKLQEVALGEE